MLRPINNHIIIEVPEDVYQDVVQISGSKEHKVSARVTGSGLVIPESSDRKRNNEGRIYQIGPGKVHPETGELIPMGYHFRAGQNEADGKPIIRPLQIGDRILYLRYAAYAIDYAGKCLLGCTEDEILAVLDEDTDDASILAVSSRG